MSLLSGERKKEKKTLADKTYNSTVTKGENAHVLSYM